MKTNIFLVTLLVVFANVKSHCQTPIASFIADSVICMNSDVGIIEQSTGATNWNWDFCDGDLALAPTYAVIENSIANVNGVSTLTIAKDAGLWYGFITNRNSHVLHRVEFLSGDVAVVQNVVELGNVDGLLNTPESMVVIKEKGLWVGFIVNQGNSKLIRLDFGSSLLNVPTAFDLGSLPGLAGPRGLDIIKSKNGWEGLITNYNGTLSRIAFGDSLQNSPRISTITGLTGKLSTVSVVNEDSVLYAYATGWETPNHYIVSFQDSLFGSYDVLDLSPSVPLSSVGRAILTKEGNGHYVILLDVSKKIGRVSFGDNFGLDPDYEELLTLSESSFTYAFDLVKANFKWSILASDFSTGKLSKVDFPDFDCGAIPLTATDQNPSLQFTLPGNYRIGLTVENVLGESSEIDKEVLVYGQPAGQISIESRCAGTSTLIYFDQMTDNVLVDFFWDINGDTVSTEEQPLYQFNTPGDKLIQLSVIDNCGSTLDVATTVSIVDPFSTSVDFAFEGILCTISSIRFADSSVSPFDSIVSRTWHVDEVLIGADSVIDYAFANPGEYNLSLMLATDAGCTLIATKIVSITAGPLVDFSAPEVCGAVPIDFTDLSSGSGINGWSWDFGDGVSSTMQNPSHQYSIPGEYDVTLVVTNDLGCETGFSQTVINRASPVASFYIELSCEQGTTNFFDQSVVDAANIDSWNWDFGGGNVSSQQNPQNSFATEGTYSVSLSVTSNYGCADSTNVQVEVLPSPEVDFIWDKSCFGTATVFSNTTTLPPDVTLQDLVWTIDGTIYSEESPILTFPAVGIYDVSLLVRGDNLCETMLSKSIEILDAPSIMISVNQPCEGGVLVMTDLTDFAGSRQWTVNGQSISSDSTHQINNIGSGEYQVMLSIQTPNGCSETISQTVLVDNLPTAKFDIAESFGAPPFLVIPENSSRNATSYNWFLNDTTLILDEFGNFVIDEVGIHEVKLVALNADSCISVTTQTIELVEPLLEVTLDFVTPLEQESKTQLVITFTNNGSVIIKNPIATIEVDGLRLAETLDIEVPALKSVNYTLGTELLAESYNSTASICVSLSMNQNQVELELSDNVKCVSVNDLSNIQAPFPNPTRSQSTISIVSPKQQDVIVTLLNGKGEFLTDFNRSINAGLNDIKLNMGGYAPGIYHVLIKLDEMTETFKIIVQ